MSKIEAFCKKIGRNPYDVSAYKLDREATALWLKWMRSGPGEHENEWAAYKNAFALCNEYADAWEADHKRPGAVTM